MKPMILFFVIATIAAMLISTASAQSTIVKLPTGSNTSDFSITDNSNNVLMKLFGDGGFSLFGNVSAGAIPMTGAGARLMWYPKKYAFRAGYVEGTQWDDANIGLYSTALGKSTTAGGYSSVAMGSYTRAIADCSTALGNYGLASGKYSTAMGYVAAAIGENSTAMGSNTTAVGKNSTAMGSSTNAGGENSTAMGSSTNASGTNSTAMGSATVASAEYSTSMGQSTTASGGNATAMGIGTIASGRYSTAMGNYTSSTGTASTAIGSQTTASAPNSTAMGTWTTASGGYSTAIGCRVTTNGMDGACIIGDYSDTPTSSSANNQMTMRFAGGYRLFSNSGVTTGVYMNAGVSGWMNYSDRNSKENFHQVDGEQLLVKISELSISEWNYRGTDASVRYVGPVAQDFYAAFHLGGKDSLGINSICIDGVNMAAIQALEKRTSELKKAYEEIAGLRQLATEREKTQQLLNEHLQAELLQLRESIKGITQKLAAASFSSGATNISENSK